MGAAARAACGCGNDLVLPGDVPAAAALVQHCLRAEEALVLGEEDDGGGPQPGQDHVFTFAEEIGPAAVSLLEEQLAGLGMADVQAALEAAYMDERDRREKPTRYFPPVQLNWQLKKAPKIQPGANVSLPAMAWPQTLVQWRQAGITDLCFGRVAVVLLAGGVEQGFAGGQALGIADIGLPSRKCIFQVLCERLLRLCRLLEKSQAAQDAEWYKTAMEVMIVAGPRRRSPSGSSRRSQHPGSDRSNEGSPTSFAGSPRSRGRSPSSPHHRSPHHHHHEGQASPSSRKSIYDHSPRHGGHSREASPRSGSPTGRRTIRKSMYSPHQEEESFEDWRDFGDAKDLTPSPLLVPLYVMVNSDNEKEVVECFKSHSYWGLDPSAVTFLIQDNTPVMNRRGQVLLQDKGCLTVHPEGCGSVYRALTKGGALADMKARGVTGAYIVAANNLLAKVADPLLIGHCRKLHLPVGLKVVERISPDEPLGTLLSYEQVLYKDEDKDGTIDEVKEIRPAVVPHHILGDDLRRRRESGDRLQYFAGDLCQYFMEVHALEKFGQDDSGYKRHLVEMRVPFMSVKLGEIVPAHAGGHPNAIRLESYVADVFDHYKQLVALHADRYAEYAPIRSHADVLTALATLSSLHEGWLRDAGAPFPETVVSGMGRDERCEVSPLVSYEGENLLGAFPTVARTRTAPKAKGKAKGRGRGTQSHQAAPARQDVHLLELPFLLMADGEVELAAGEYPPLRDGGTSTGARATVMQAPKGLALEREPALRYTANVPPPDIAEGKERLCATPPWLRKQEDDWEEELARKMEEYQRQLEHREHQKHRNRRHSHSRRSSHREQREGSPRRGSAGSLLGRGQRDQRRGSAGAPAGTGGSPGSPQAAPSPSRTQAQGSPRPARPSVQFTDAPLG